MEKLYFMLSVLLLAGVIAVSVFPASTAAESGTQVFTPARYALTDAEIDVSVSVPNGPVQEQKVMFKLDTVTGDVWVLQLTVNGQNDPTFAAANWVKVQHGSINPPGNNTNSDPQGF